MELVPGTRLGAYELLGRLGAGAMGEVYRARDTRLGREVAIKILPAEFAQSPDRRRRFEQESRAASALNHPNIVAVYDAGEQDGVAYIVSELVDGESLRDLIERGPVPRRKALEVAAQVADGLAAAHAAGVVHRDLKPENIMLTRDGRAKILDFGLARYQPPAAQGTATMTQPGMVMGTVGYMSPEQVAGGNADARSDIFSLGIVLHEMLAGKTAFGRATSIETMAAILREEPAELPESVPPALRHIVFHCLEKEPSHRFQSAQDLAFNLRGLSSGGSTMIAAAPALARQRRLPLLAIVAVVLAVVCVLAIALLLAAPGGATLAAYHFTPLATDGDVHSHPAWSPDGKDIAYARQFFGGDDRIMVRGLESLVPSALAKIDSANALFWSADGARIYLHADDGVWSLGRAGGEKVLVLKGSFPSATMSPDGQTLAVWKTTNDHGRDMGSVWISSPPGAELRAYTPAPFQVNGGYTPVYIRFSPDGRRILAAFPRGSGTEVWLLPFPDGAKAQGQPHRIFAARMFGADVPELSWMPDSRHFVMAALSDAHTRNQLWMADSAKETLQPITADEGNKSEPAVSPDGTKLAYQLISQQSDIVELPLAGGPPRPLIATSRSESFPEWSRTGSALVYVTDRSGHPEIWLRSAQGDWERPLVTQRDFPGSENLGFVTPSFSPDGTRVVYTRHSSKQFGELWLSPSSGGTPVRLNSTDDFAIGASWSPDGNWIAYFSAKGGLVKARVGSSEPPTRIAVKACSSPPEWSPDGRWISCSGKEGVELISPDGKEHRTVSKRHCFASWARDSKSLYALFDAGDDKWEFGSIDAASGAEKTIYKSGSVVIFAKDRLSPSPDGKSVATTVQNVRGDIWMLEGFPQPRSFWSRLWPFGS